MKQYLMYFILLITIGCEDNSSNLGTIKSDDEVFMESMIGLWSNGTVYKIQFNSNNTFADSSFSDSLNVYSSGKYEVLNGVIYFSEFKYSYYSKYKDSIGRGFNRFAYPLTAFIQNDSLNIIPSEILVRLDSNNTVGIIGKWRSDYYRYSVMFSKSTPRYSGYARTDYEFKSDLSTYIERLYNNIDSVNIIIQDVIGIYQYNPPTLNIESNGVSITKRVQPYNNKLILLFDSRALKLTRLSL